MLPKVLSFFIGIKIDYRTRIQIARPIYIMKFCRKTEFIIIDWLTERKK